MPGRPIVLTERDACCEASRAFADEYHWRKGVGPRRPDTLNPNWGGVIEPNHFGTHEFMDFVDQIGSEAYLSVNVGSGHPAGSRRMTGVPDDRPQAPQPQAGGNGSGELLEPQRGGADVGPLIALLQQVLAALMVLG